MQAILENPHDSEALQRAKKVASYVLAVWIGWVASTAFYAVPQKSATIQHVQTVVVPTLKRELAKEKEKPPKVIFVPDLEEHHNSPRVQ